MGKGEIVYDAIFKKSFAKHDRKKIGYLGLLACLFITFTSLITIFQPPFSHFHLDSTTKPEFEVADIKIEGELKILGNHETKQEIKGADILINGRKIMDSKSKQDVMVDESQKQEEIKTKNSQQKQETKIQEIESRQEMKVGNSEILEKENKIPVIDTKQEFQEIKEKNHKPVCNVLEQRSDFCEIEGDIRVHGKSSTVLFHSTNQNGIFAGNESWKIKPYPRKSDKSAMSSINEFMVKSFPEDNETPHCTINHTVPAVIFSVNGYVGNHFHAFADLLVPLFLTTYQFHQEVQFLVTNYRSSWLSKYQPIISHLSKYPVIDIDKENDIHCYQKVIVGLLSHRDIGIDPSKSPNNCSMMDFTYFLRKAYSLKRSTPIKITSNKISKKPRLLIVSRKRTRKFTNENEIVKMAKTLGYEVIVAEPGVRTTTTTFAEMVNSCDVMMGVHGAGLTNFVFLPTNAVLIQIVPYGGLEWVSRNCFGGPAKEVKLKYLEYKIRVEESSLIEEYPLDNVVLKDPHSIGKQGWNLFSSIYLKKQDVKLDVGRFRATLLEALELLH